jgi:hypothetical protein
LSWRRPRARGVAREVDRGDDEDATGADVFDVEVGDLRDRRVGEQALQRRGAQIGIDRGADEKAPVLPDQEDRDDGEQHSDEDRSHGIRRRGSRELVRQDAGEGDHETDERRGILEEDRAQRRVGRAMTWSSRSRRRRRFARGLPRRLQERRPRGRTRSRARCRRRGSGRRARAMSCWMPCMIDTPAPTAKSPNAAKSDQTYASRP